jgi:hypothetical protein
MGKTTLAYKISRETIVLPLCTTPALGHPFCNLGYELRPLAFFLNEMLGWGALRAPIDSFKKRGNCPRTFQN